MRAWANLLRGAYRFIVLFVVDTAAIVGSIAVVNRIASDHLVSSAASGIWLRAMFSLAVAGSYRPGRARMSMARLTAAVLLTITTYAAQAVLWDIPVRLSHLIPLAPSLLFLLAAGRSLVEWVLRGLFRNGIGQIRAIVLGPATDYEFLKRASTSANGSELQIVDHIPLDYMLGNRHSGLGSAVEAAARRAGAAALIVTSSLSAESLDEVVSAGFEHGLTVAMVPRTLQAVSPRFDIRETSVGLLLQLHPRGFGMPQLLIKRAMDIVLSVLLLIIAAPIFLIVAIAIHLDSPGPIFFAQRRAGIGGTAFRMLKFRTMTVDAENRKATLHHMNASGDPRLFKIPNDPRITRVGRWIRRYSIDELPQLFNVLEGTMSLIGPRPFFMEDLASYEPHHFERLSVLPGITGWWQVKGRSSVIDFEEVVRLDTEYIRNWSIGFDCRILLRTVPAILRRHGAF